MRHISKEQRKRMEIIIKELPKLEAQIMKKKSQGSKTNGGFEE